MKKIIKFLFGWTLPFFKWLSHSFEGSDGKASSRKLSGFVFTALVCTSTGKVLTTDNISQWHVLTLALVACVYLLNTGIITIQNIISIWKER